MQAIIGVDPVEHMRLGRRERYLQRVSAALPPLGSAQREALRGGNRSLSEYITSMKQQQA